MTRLAEVRRSIDAWCAGRDWRWRAVLLTLLAWQAVRPLRDPDAWHIYRGITFGAHELGHLVFSFGGEWLAVAGGSLMQLLVPAGAMVAMVATPRKDWFGVAVGLLWIAASLADLAPYIADARAQDLDLVSFSEDGGGHDWHFLLADAGLLKSDAGVARLARVFAVIALVAGIGIAVWLFRRMARLKPPESVP